MCKLLVQALYAQLKAPDIDLEHDCPLGLSLVAAIRHSLQTPGALLNTTLLVRPPTMLRNSPAQPQMPACSMVTCAMPCHCSHVVLGSYA